jgi:hypothetical protein
VKVTGYWPEIVGVPLTVPPEERCRPGGNEPEVTAHEYGASPPVAWSELE